MLLELHILQNFAPSNLNRDDTGSPKDCEFGGYRRARISSQCFKRAMREAMRDGGLLQPDDLAARTKLFVATLADRFTRKHGKDAVEADGVARAAIAAAGLKLEPNAKMQYLLFLGNREIDAIEALCLERWDALKPAPAGEPTGDGTPAAPAGRGRKKAATEAPVIDAALSNAFKGLLNGGKAADLALFGRMIADLPDRNVEGSCQVAHALSTNAVNVEFDFYTAIDDLKSDDVTGADMLGTIEFNSACYYRYLNLDVDQLAGNLQGDVDLTRRAVEAFVRAAVTAVPSGKQNSMAAQNPPSLVLAVVRERGLWSLANAFVKPVRPGLNGDLVAQSIKCLDTHWGNIARMYGERQIAGKWLCMLDDEMGERDAPTAGTLSHLRDATVPSIDDLVERAMGTLAGTPADAVTAQ